MLKFSAKLRGPFDEAGLDPFLDEGLDTARGGPREVAGFWSLRELSLME